MALQSKTSKLPSQPDSNQNLDATLGDLRFRALLCDDDWERLPPATRQRFSKRLAGGETTVYVGEVEEARFSRIGWALAQMARLIGGPLPTGAETHVPMIVTVTEDAATGGQIWTRVCAAGTGFLRSFILQNVSWARRGWRNMSDSASAWRFGYSSRVKPCCFAAQVTPCRLDV
jgi:hypothetical protein